MKEKSCWANDCSSFSLPDLHKEGNSFELSRPSFFSLTGKIKLGRLGSRLRRKYAVSNTPVIVLPAGYFSHTVKLSKATVYA